jgi:hypothetical protein
MRSIQIVRRAPNCKLLNSSLDKSPRKSGGTASIPLRAELLGSDRAEIFGVTVRGDAPILKLCRWLVRAGYTPTLPLEAFRGATLALRVRSIGKGAQLRIAADPPRFVYEPFPAAPAQENGSDAPKRGGGQPDAPAGRQP